MQCKILNAVIQNIDKLIVTNWLYSGFLDVEYGASGHDFVLDFENDTDTLNIYDPLYGSGLTATQVVDTCMTMQTTTRFYFDFGSGNVLHVLSGTALALTDFHDDVIIV